MTDIENKPTSKAKEKIAFVCQRYGLEVNGGSELYCRQVAERLTQIYDVTVYTTCALDYTDWANKYAPGQEDINEVHVRRFRVAQIRIQSEFGLLCERLLKPDHTDEEEEDWIDKQGPFCPELIETLKNEHKEYKAILFMTYLYYTTARGITKGLDNAIMIPTVHDEPWVYLRFYDKVFASAKGIAWNTPEERAFAQKRFPQIKNRLGVMTGIGIDEPEDALPEVPDEIRNVSYLVYAGRIDMNKGCQEMIDYFLRYKHNSDCDLKLVLMGKEVMKVPNHPDIINLGFVSEEMKYAVMADAVALLLFSRFESLSMVVLESMMMGRPILVTEHCEVLKGHCVRSNAGLYFKDYPEFESTLNYLMTHRKEYEIMCKNGKKYVEENYRWDVITRRYCELIESLGRDIQTAHNTDKEQSQSQTVSQMPARFRLQDRPGNMKQIHEALSHHVQRIEEKEAGIS